MAEILFKEGSCKIMGAMFEVYKELGRGFLEPVYQESVQLELGDQKVPFVAQVPLKLKYKHHHLKSKYIPDAICYDKSINDTKTNQSELLVCFVFFVVMQSSQIRERL